MIELGRIVAGGWSYQITDADALELARAAYWEGGTSPAATLWAYAGRAYLRRFRRESLQQLVRAHSQPLNPRWSGDGDFCRPGGRYHGLDECSPARLARRAAAQSSSWSDIPGPIAEKVRLFCAARLPNPCPRVVDFAASSKARSWLAADPRGLLVLDAGNWYLADGTSRLWPAELVGIESSGRRASGSSSGSSSGGIAGGLLGALALALVLGSRVAG